MQWPKLEITKVLSIIHVTTEWMVLSQLMMSYINNMFHIVDASTRNEGNILYHSWLNIFLPVRVRWYLISEILDDSVLLKHELFTYITPSVNRNVFLVNLLFCAHRASFIIQFCYESSFSPMQDEHDNDADDETPKLKISTMI